MSEVSLLKDVALIWLVSLFVGHICIRLKQPVIAGYMLVGVLVGPYVLKLISNPEQVRVLAEFGVAMLLFTLGIDLSIKQIFSGAARILSAGVSQILLSILVACFLGQSCGLVSGLPQGLLFGSICALSSSVVISRVLMDRAEQDSFHGQILISIALVQDLALVFIIPFLPVLEHGFSDLSGLAFSALKATAFVLAVVFGAIKIVPHVLARAAKSNSREIFLLTILVLSLGIALLSQMAGLSLALGAFLAGIMVSESTYAHQALHDVSPFKDVFSTIFFVSVGMLLNPIFIAAHLLEVFIFVFLLIAGKAIIGTMAALCATTNLRSAILVGVGLANIGEFSFILLTMGYDLKLINDAVYNLFFAGAVVTMIASPALLAITPKILQKLRGLNSDADKSANLRMRSDLKNHVILCGFGRIGRNLGLVLETHQIPFIVIELNASIIEELALRGIPHIYGDALNQKTIAKGNLEEASCVVLTMPDPFSAKTVSEFIREKNSTIRIVARAHRTDDLRIFRAAGVNAVVQPEFQASIEITRLVLHSLKRPAIEINRALEQIRTHGYAVFQPDIEELSLTDVHESFADNQIGIWFQLGTDSFMHHRCIGELNIRQKTGATITAVKRGVQTFAFPEPAFQLAAQDEIYAVGSFDQLRNFEETFKINSARISEEYKHKL